MVQHSHTTNVEENSLKIFSRS